MVNKDDDEKDSKIKRQSRQQSLRIMTCLAIVVVIGIGSMFYPELVRENEDITQRRQHSQQVLLNNVRVGFDQNKNNNNENQNHNFEKQEHFLKLQTLKATFDTIEKEVRDIKATGVMMEVDEKSLEATGRLQDAARALCKERYGDYGSKPYRLQVDLEFQDDDETLSKQDKTATFIIEMAPIELIPYSVYNFLEVARGYQSGGFHRRAGHVLQATVKSTLREKPLAFQEYSKQHPHAKGTVGYCGRPSGSHGCWYISTLDNTRNHGPGSQQKKNPYEADANFGRVLDDVTLFEKLVPRIRDSMKKDGFLNNKKDWVLVTGFHILVPDGVDGSYKVWDGPTSQSVDVE